jgi:predicted RNase H-like HicB family nuclease
MKRQKRQPEGVAFYKGIRFRYLVDRKGNDFHITFEGRNTCTAVAKTKADVPIVAQKALDAYVDTFVAEGRGLFSWLSSS